MRKSCGAFVCVFLALVWSPACGDDAEEARQNCSRMLDAFAKAWERCGRASYEDALSELEPQFSCDDAESSSSGRSDRCVRAVDALSCPAVEAGTIPDVCTESISD